MREKRGKKDKGEERLKGREIKEKRAKRGEMIDERNERWGKEK